MINRLKNKSFQLLIKTKVATVAKPLFDIGKIIFQKICTRLHPSIFAMEYLQDYASPETKKVGLELVQKELENIPGEKIRKLTEEHLADIVNRQRDFRF